MRDLLHFKAHNGVNSICEYHIIDMNFTKVVIMVQGEDNKGMSVTNAVADIASLIQELHDLPVNQIFVEHYPPRDESEILDEQLGSFDVVFFKDCARGEYHEPSWRRIPLDNPLWMMLNAAVRINF